MRQPQRKDTCSANLALRSGAVDNLLRSSRARSHVFRQASTRRSAFGGTWLSSFKIAGTSGTRCSKRLLSALTTSTATGSVAKFCWNSRDPLHDSSRVRVGRIGMGCKADFAGNSTAIGKKFNAADRPSPGYHGPRGVMQRVPGFWSIVKKTSNRVSASARSFPFLMPAHPQRATVEHSCPTSNVPSLRGRSSSSRMRIWDECRVRLFKHCYGQFATDRRKIL